MNLNQVHLFVRNIAHSVEFYKKLGLKQIVEDTDYVRFLCPNGDATLSLILTQDTKTPSGITICFECDKLDETVEQLKQKGIKFESDPTDQPWLWRDSYLFDPDGHRICLYYAGKNRINPPWRINKEI